MTRPRFLLLLVFLLVPSAQVCMSQERVEPEWIFVNEVDWREPPPELAKTYLEGDAQLVILYPSGDFAYVSATVFRDRQTGRITLCSGCGHSIRQGTWERMTRNTVQVQSEWIYRNLPPANERDFSEPTVATWTIATDPSTGVVLSLSNGTTAYEPLEKLANLETLQAFLFSAKN